MGPLAGIRIVEFAGIGPGPMAAMLLADLGAEVIRVDRLEPSGLGVDKPMRFDLLLRGRGAIALDLKHPDGIELALSLLEAADGCIEGFRPGTMERLGLGPEVALARNPRLVYGRMTGFGQSGPLAKAAGHDLNYIAISGALAAIGRQGQAPTPPMNLLGDFAGGSLYLVVGMLAAFLEAKTSGRGQVVDAAVSDGTAHLMTMIYGLHAAGMWKLERGTNLLDGGSPIYEVYACADGRFVSIAPIELKFRRELFQRLGLEAEPNASDLGEKLTALFKTRTSQEWCGLLEGTDACFAPVLDMADAPAHRHNAERGTFVEVEGVVQPAAAPRFSRSEPAPPKPPENPGEGGRRTMLDWGIGEARIAACEASGVLGR